MSYFKPGRAISGLFASAMSCVIAFAFVACGSKSEDKPKAEVDLTQTPGAFQPAIPPRVPAPVDPSTVVARVNENEITQSELIVELGLMKQRAAGRVPPERMAQLEPLLREQALEALISKTLLIDEIAAQEVAVTPEEVQEAIAKIESTLPEGVTLEQVAAQSNTDIAKLKEDVALDLKVNKLVVSSEGEVDSPSDDDIAAFYEENKERFNVPENVTARHILIAVPAGADEATKLEKKQQLVELRQRLVAGEDFGEVATTYSEGPSRTRGGSLGKVVRGQTVPRFEEAAFSQEIGEIGEIIETRFGYHVIQVEAREEAHLIPIEEAKTTVSNYLTSQMRGNAIQNYIKSLRDKADVEILN